MLTVVGASEPGFYTTFKNNSMEKEHKEAEFFVLNKSYTVGDDNPFTFKPEVKYLEYDPIKGSVTEFYTAPSNANFSYSLDIKKNNVYEKADQTVYLETQNTKTCAFDFSPNAIGQTFRLTVMPTLGETVYDEYKNSIEFTVIDGYNAYHDYELAYVSNYAEYKNSTELSEGNCQYAWTKFRADHGLTLNPMDIRAVILHSDMKLTENSIPENFFYTKELVNGRPNEKWLVGTLIDQKHSGIYHREVDADHPFSLIGNYFHIDGSKIPQTEWMYTETDNNVTYDENGNITSSNIVSHVPLFRVNGRGLDSQLTITDVNVSGNSQKINDFRMQGGFMFLKTEGTNSVLDNFITRACFITAMVQTRNTASDITNMKCYDTFNSPLYNWGCEDITLDNCIIKNSGGPAIICDAYMTDDDVKPINPRIVATNCTFENPTAGDEAWFTMALGKQGLGTMLVSGVKDLNTTYTATNGLNSYVSTLKTAGINVNPRSFLKDVNGASMFNIYCIVKDDGNDVAAANGYTPYISINGSVMDYGTGATKFEEPIKNEAHSTALANFIKEKGLLGNSSPSGAWYILETSGKDIATPGLMGINGTTPNFPRATDQTSMLMEVGKMLSGDTLNLYYNTGTTTGMLGVMFELFEA